MRTLTLIAIIPTALIILGACATTPKITSETNPNANVAAYKAFALLPLPKDIPGGDPGMILRYGKTAQDAMRQALDSKGYSDTNIENADFLVNIKATIVPKVQVTDWDLDYGYYGRRGYWGRGYYPYGTIGSDIDIDTYEEGTLIIEIFDASNKDLAWVGWATGKRKKEPISQEYLTSLIASILADFPENE